MDQQEYTYQARIAICEPTKTGEFNKHAISGVLIAMEGQPLLSDTEQWENIQCEVIIRPIKRLGEAKIDNLRLDQAATALGDDSQWEKTKPKKKK